MDFSINRNIVECKEIFIYIQNVDKSVLIETLWNVKEYVILLLERAVKVLIETLWNVKMV